MRAAELIPTQRRAAVSKRRILTFCCQRWFLSFGLKLRDRLVSLMRPKERTAEEWISLPLEGVWNVDVSRKGMRLCSPDCQSCVPGKTWREAPGLYA